MIAALTAGFLLAAAPQDDIGRCFYLLRNPEGGFDILSSTRLAGDLRDPTAKLPNAPDNLVLVQCARPTLALADGDERALLEYKVPLFIQDGKRVLFLEIDKGQLKVKFDEGAPTEAELPALQTAIDILQKKIQGEL